MKNTIFFVLAIFVYLLSSCDFKGNYINGSDKISLELKKEIESLNKEFWEALINKNEKKAISLLSLELLKNIEKNETLGLDILFNYVESYSILSVQQVIEEFHVKGTVNSIISIPSQLTANKNYSINYIAATSESYVSFVKVEWERGHSTCLAFIYGKYDDEWKINFLHLGSYTLHNRTAPMYYEKAKEEYDNGNLVNSYVNIYLSTQTLEPGGDAFSYDIKANVQELNDKIVNRLNENYTFPMELDAIDTKPVVFRIYTQEMENTFSPMIEYVSKINQNDTAQLKLENEKIRKIIPGYFKGINQNNDFVCYGAYNEMPNDSIPVTRFGFVHSLK